MEITRVSDIWIQMHTQKSKLSELGISTSLHPSYGADNNIGWLHVRSKGEPNIKETKQNSKVIWKKKNSSFWENATIKLRHCEADENS